MDDRQFEDITDVEELGQFEQLGQFDQFDGFDETAGVEGFGPGYYNYRPLGFRRLLRRLIGRRIRIILVGRRAIRVIIIGVRGRFVIVRTLRGRVIYLPIRRISYFTQF